MKDEQALNCITEVILVFWVIRAFPMDDRIDPAEDNVMFSNQSSGWLHDWWPNAQRPANVNCKPWLQSRKSVSALLIYPQPPAPSDHRSAVPLQAEVMCDPVHATGTYIFREMQTRASHQYHSISLSTASLLAEQHEINDQINYLKVQPHN